jgi:hypothetical protein
VVVQLGTTGGARHSGVNVALGGVGRKNPFFSGKAP